MAIMRKSKPVVLEKHHFNERGETFSNNMLEILDHQDFLARINILGFQINLCFIRVGFPIETLLEGNKPEVKDESVIEFRKIKIKDTWEFLILMQKPAD